MEKTELFDEAAQRRVEYWVLGLGVVAAGFSVYAWGWTAGAAVGCGALLSWLNFRWMRRGISEMLGSAAGQMESRRARKQPVLKFIARYALLLGGLFVILIGFHWPALAFFCGLLAIVPGVLIEAICELVRSMRQS